jgi:hypothetical protein
VTGGRTPSFYNLSTGEATVPSFSKDNAGGGKHPPLISHFKRPHLKVETGEKLTLFKKYALFKDLI